MNEKKQSPECVAEPVSTYQTGSTSPPRSHGGIVAFLLSATIFICGVSTIFSLMRINLLQKVTVQADNQTCKMAFAKVPQPEPVRASPDEYIIQGQTLDPFWRAYQDLPQGFYVTEVCGLPFLSGDIIVRFGDTPVTDWESLQRLISQYKPGDRVSVTVYRNNQQLSLELTIYE